MMGQVLGRGGKGGYDPLSHRSPTLDPPDGFQNWEKFGNCHIKMQ